ncbi:unnamed protein product [Caenorhabditis nigoni]
MLAPSPYNSSPMNPLSDRPHFCAEPKINNYQDPSFDYRCHSSGTAALVARQTQQTSSCNGQQQAAKNNQEDNHRAINRAPLKIRLDIKKDHRLSNPKISHWWIRIGYMWSPIGFYDIHDSMVDTGLYCVIIKASYSTKEMLRKIDVLERSTHYLQLTFIMCLAGKADIYIPRPRHKLIWTVFPLKLRCNGLFTL